MTRGVDAPKVQPDDVVRAALDTLEAGGDETLADDVSRSIKQNLSNGVTCAPFQTREGSATAAATLAPARAMAHDSDGVTVSEPSARGTP